MNLIPFSISSVIEICVIGLTAVPILPVLPGKCPYLLVPGESDLFQA
jgi:hypothetical protein